jgi:DNA-binding MarR family transcriptional regulator
MVEGLDERWARLLLVAFQTYGAFEQKAAEVGLTLPQALTLNVIGSRRTAAMGEVAGCLRVDASNMTGVVDRLEHRGLVERRPSRNDRRIKTLVLTPDGRAVRHRLLAALGEPPPLYGALSQAAGERLSRLLAEALGAGEDGDGPGHGGPSR